MEEGRQEERRKSRGEGKEEGEKRRGRGDRKSRKDEQVGKREGRKGGEKEGGGKVDLATDCTV